MSDDSTTQCLLFPGSFHKPVVAQFDQREGSSDGGALLLTSPTTTVAYGSEAATGWQAYSKTKNSRRCGQPQPLSPKDG
jgi:hypothetical protein